MDAPSPTPSDRGVETPRALEVTASREARVGKVRVRRALPRRGHRTVGAWCFADHMGPLTVSAQSGLDVAPHPHCGLQTLTWLIRGEALHRDSLGTEQTIRAGEVNLMTAGRGVAHSEEATGTYAGELHGIQLWIAQPSATRNGNAEFAHFDAPARLDVAGGVATLLTGTLAGVTSPARADSEIVGAEIVAHRRGEVELDPTYEHALIVLEGALRCDGVTVAPGQLGYLAPGRDEVAWEVHEPTTVVLLGGVPFDEEIVMWWNFVARSRDEIDAADAAWREDDGRFGTVHSALARTVVDAPAWEKVAES